MKASELIATVDRLAVMRDIECIDFEERCIAIYEDYFEHGFDEAVTNSIQPHQLVEVTNLIRTIYYKSTF